jgi:hypothetical protein
MLRSFCCSMAVLAIFVAGLQAEGKKDKGDKDNKKAKQATITKVDAKKGTITVSMKNDQGKDVERTFKLTPDIRMFDSTGKAVAIDVFKSGNDILVVEQEGKLKEIRKGKSQSTTGKKTEETVTDKKGKDK